MSRRRARPSTGPSATPLDRWLTKKGLRRNPFEKWTADHDQDLPNYFVDVGGFDELLRLAQPCIVFAERGCGKTAQRQMLTSQCCPVKRGSPWLAITYTYGGFEQALTAAEGDLNRLSAVHHVRALLPLGLAALAAEAALNIKVRRALASSRLSPRWKAYVSYLAPHLDASLVGTSSSMDQLNSVELVGGFVELCRGVGLESCIVFVDGVDEFPLIASDPSQAARFLAPLLGTLPLIEYPRLAFKFFLPQELEPALRVHAWFRPTDRVKIFPITWDDNALLELIRQRLIHFSSRKTSDEPYEALAQLCEDKLAQVIDRELVDLAKGLPRATLMLADMLLQNHCRQPDPPDLIELKTWQQVKDQWPLLRRDFVRQKSKAKRPVPEPVPPAASTASGSPVLAVDEVSGLVWLGQQEIRGQITPQDYFVLVCLYHHKDAVCTKDLLAREAWPEVSEKDAVTDQAIAQSIRRLRKLFKELVPDKEFIQTVKGKRREIGGYRLYPGGIA